MHRLFFLLPDQSTARNVVAGLTAFGVPVRHLHVVASIEQRLEGLPEATVWQKTELAHGIEIGVSLGGTAGLLGGLLAVAFPPAGLVLGGGALLAMSLAGAGFGGLVTALMSSHDHSHDLAQFEAEIENGRILMLVDVPGSQQDAVTALVRHHHPAAEIGVAGRK